MEFDRTRNSSKRSRGATPVASTSLSNQHIADALSQSIDDGGTLDLTKLSLTGVGEEAAQELAAIGREDPDDDGSVQRVALSNNRLASLPTDFALLSRLRYLNLKNNNFTVFPDVLTVMPSLDTLDISHNKIKRLPSHPGSLIHLRVFSFSRNKITRLPSYLINFRDLELLKADRNPLEWPPNHVMETPGNLESAQSVKDWVRSVQKWMEENSSKNELTSPISEDSLTKNNQLFGTIEESLSSWSLHQREFEAGVTPHARTFSIDSTFSISSIAESSQEYSDHDEHPVSTPPDQPPLHLDILSSYATVSSPIHSPDSYLPSPVESVYSNNSEEMTAISGDFQQQQQQQQQQQMHGRNASYAGDRSSGKTELINKKSMPELRTTKTSFGRKPSEQPDRVLASGRNILTEGKSFEELSMPSPLSQRQDSGSSLESRMVRPFTRTVTVGSPTRPAPSMDVERNSYFRRLSTLPLSTISVSVPRPLLNVIDSVRSILFAVCQIYQTLQHYTVYAIDDRLTSVLRKVLDPASADMTQLINALDNFDVTSRKTLPSPATCRAVIESCKDTVAVFNKAVGVLSLQLKVLATRDDVRYLRQMLLILYGATAEISHAWHSMIPHIEAIKPLLRESRHPVLASKPHSSLPQGRYGAGHHPFVPSTGTVAEEDETPPAPSSLQPKPLLNTGRTRLARRHAGSFSSKDVEIGKKLPSFEDVPELPPNLHARINTRSNLRGGFGRRTGTSPVIPGPLSSSSNRLPSYQQTPSLLTTSPGSGGLRPGQPIPSHSRQGSLVSHPTASPASSPQMTFKVPPLLQIPQIASSSSSMVDKEALDAMKKAVEAAPAIWSMMDEILGVDQEMSTEVRATLSAAKSVTVRLDRNIRALQSGDPSADRKALRDDAHSFVKLVVHLSNIMKTRGGSSTTLRSNMVKLTNATEEFVILLHVSSYSPSSTPRQYSPMIGGQVPPSSLAAISLEDTRPGASFTRSRSAQASSNARPVPFPKRDGSRSALPSQSFNIPTVQRIRRIDPVEAG